MSFKISSCVENDYLKIVASGSIESASEYKIIAEDYYKEWKNKKIKNLIIDERQLELTISISDVCDIFDFIFKNMPKEVMNIRIVMISSEENRERSLFSANYYKNRGYNINIVFSMEEAMEFLRGSDA
jgi:hypothetical protein